MGNPKDKRPWTVNYITSQGVYTDHNGSEPTNSNEVRKDYKTRTAWIGEHGKNPASFRSINLDVGD